MLRAPTQPERHEWRRWRKQVLAELGVQGPRPGRPSALDPVRTKLVRGQLAMINRGVDKFSRYLAKVYGVSFITIRRASKEREQ